MSRSTTKRWLASAVLVALIMSAAACGPGGGPSSSEPSASAATTPRPSAAPASASPIPSLPTAEPTNATVAVAAYFALQGNLDEPAPLVPVHRDVSNSDAIATAAMQALLDGPTEDERAHDLVVGTIGTEIPEGTRLLGIDIQADTATVDLSSEFATGDLLGSDIESWTGRLAQVTYTLTQFPTVDGVRFSIEGKPTAMIEGHEGLPIDRATRSAYADQLPGIFIDRPAWGGPLSDPLTVTGIAQILGEPAQFEAALVNRTTDEIILQQTVVAPCASGGCWQPPGGGEFEFQLAIPERADRTDLLLRVWVLEPDGGLTSFLQYPLE